MRTPELDQLARRIGAHTDWIQRGVRVFEPETRTFLRLGDDWEFEESSQQRHEWDPQVFKRLVCDACQQGPDYTDSATLGVLLFHLPWAALIPGPHNLIWGRPEYWEASFAPDPPPEGWAHLRVVAPRSETRQGAILHAVLAWLEPQ